MQIFIRTLSGKHIALTVGQTRFVNEIKKEIENKEQIPTNLQRLIFSGKQLEDEYTLNEYSISQNATLILTLRLPGGIINANSPSKSSGPVENDHSTATTLLDEGNSPKDLYETPMEQVPLKLKTEHHMQIQHQVPI